MDKYNVISITNDLSALQNDMIQWSNLPYDFRLRSDEDCIRLYGMTNTELFNRLRAVLVSTQKPVEDIDVIGKNISESSGDVNQNQLNLPANFDFSEDQDLLRQKKEIAAELDKSPTIVIISPFEDKNKKEYNIEFLDKQIQKYNMLNDKFKLLSDSYSTDLWGYDVQNMYYIMKRILANQEEQDTVDFEFRNRIQANTDAENPIIPVIQNMQEKVLKEDTLGLLSIKLDETFVKNPVQKAIYETKINPVINKALYENDFNLPQVVPYFTLSEMNEMGITLEDINPESYVDNLIKASSDYKDGLVDESVLLNLGWNPSVEVNKKSLEFARNRQIRWFNEYGCQIIDLTKWNTDVSILESTVKMENVYKQKNLYPVYIVLSFTNTVFGKIINQVKHSVYSHSGIALDSKLDKIYTFRFDKNTNGFGIEGLSNYLANYQDAKISVMTLFVEKKVKDKLEKILQSFNDIKDKTKYGFGNLFNILLNRAIKNGASLAMVCSQFVDTILKMVNIDLNGKSSNLVTPQDFMSIKRPKVFNLYEGLVREFKEKLLQAKEYKLLTSSADQEVRYSNVVEAVCGLTLDLSNIIISESGQQILQEINQLMTPVAVIYEKKLPFEISDKGDIIIHFIKPLEQQYQEAHRLLKMYGENNLEGIKHELARLFYINYRIEKKIKKMDHEDANYKKLIDLRARVLNDFKKYFKVVLDKEPDFNFYEYYKKSEYYDGNIIIDNKIVKITKNLILRFLKSLGL